MIEGLDFESRSFGDVDAVGHKDAIHHVADLVGAPDVYSRFADLAHRMMIQAPFRMDCEDPPEGEGRTLVLTTVRQAVPYGAALNGFWETYQAGGGEGEIPILGHIDPLAKHLRRADAVEDVIKRYEGEEVERISALLDQNDPVSIVYVFDEHVIKGRSMAESVRMVMAAGAPRVSRSPLYASSFDTGRHIQMSELPLLRRTSPNSYSLQHNPDTEAVARVLRDMRLIGSVAATNYLAFQKKHTAL